MVLDATALITTSKQLRAVCGAGGTAKDGVIEVQGDCHFCTVDVVTLRKPAKTDWLIFAFLMRVKRHLELTQISFNGKRPATTILTARAGLIQLQPALSFQRCGSSSSTRLAGCVGRRSKTSFRYA